MFLHFAAHIQLPKPQKNSIMSQNETVIETFPLFFDGWLIRQECFYHELLHSASKNQEQDQETRDRDLIRRVLAHYKEYYTEKSKLIHENVFLALSPPWLTPLERSLLWVGDFQPSLIFQLTAGISLETASLAEETAEEERWVVEELGRVQATVAAPAAAEAARVAVNGEVTHVELAIGRLTTAMEKLAVAADRLRCRTAKRAVERLSPAQTVQLLAAFANFKLGLRAHGMHMQWGSSNH